MTRAPETAGDGDRSPAPVTDPAPEVPRPGAGGDTDGTRRGAGNPAGAAAAPPSDDSPPSAPGRGQPARSGQDFRAAWQRARSARNAARRRGRGHGAPEGGTTSYAPGMSRRKPPGGGDAT